VIHIIKAAAAQAAAQAILYIIRINHSADHCHAALLHSLQQTLLGDIRLNFIRPL
jgi:hypothetical protein